jgi:LysR family transcriptional regulator, regulator of abg operon
VIEEAHQVRRMPPPRILVQCADYPTLLALVAQSELLCVVPHPALVPETQHDSLRILRIREGLPQYEVCLFWGPARPGVQPEVIEAVVQALTSTQAGKTGA